MFAWVSIFFRREHVKSASLMYLWQPTDIRNTLSWIFTWDVAVLSTRVASCCEHCRFDSLSATVEIIRLWPDRWKPVISILNWQWDINALNLCLIWHFSQQL
jgi:hypothetical protein